MNEIINETFHVGERYQSMVNGEEFIVDSVKTIKKQYGTGNGGIRTQTKTVVYFRHIRSNTTTPAELSQARRLLLRKEG